MNELVSGWPQFLTATIINWHNLLKEDKYKYLIIDSLRFLVAEKRIRVFGFVIMINHIHLIWQMRAAVSDESVQRDFLKYCSQKIKADLRRTDPVFLEQFKVEKKDRNYQFWQRGSLSVELTTSDFFFQKLNYIHLNPVRAGICEAPEDYIFSSARFYQTGFDDFGFLSHYHE